ncbi:MAG: hypothetical protein NZ853_04350 [Leptospiraceae bacterium]|nr:hypothetical protein [Leptospiraceae bacterium]MDW7975405.1 DUF2231 domain-containing protein [Leptospiraceae bacterium]
MNTLFIFLQAQEAYIKLKNIPSDTPFHPVIVHFPIVLTLLLPFFILAILILVKKNVFGDKSQLLWNFIIILQVINLIFLYFSLYSGDIENELLQHSPYLKQTIEQHEVFAESLFVFSIFLLAIIFLGHSKIGFHFLMRILSLVMSFIAVGLVLITGYLGGKIVYELDAPYFRKVLIEEYHSQFKTNESTKEKQENIPHKEDSHDKHEKHEKHEKKDKD